MRLLGRLVVALGLLGLAACGSSPTSPDQPLSQTDITNIANAVGPAVSLALSRIGSSLGALSVRGAGSNGGQLVRPESSTITVSGSSPCPESGSANVSGSFVDNTNSSGTGSASMNMQIG